MCIFKKKDETITAQITEKNMRINISLKNISANKSGCNYFAVYPRPLSC